MNELDIERTRAPQGSAFRWKKRNEEQDGQRRQLAELRNLAGKGRKGRTGGAEGGLGRGSSTATTASSACSTRRRAVRLQCSARLGKHNPALENVVGRLEIAVGASAVRW